MTHEPDGSQDYPYEPEFFENYITGAQLATITAPATGAVWYNVVLPYGTWILGTDNEDLLIKVYVEGIEFDPVVLENFDADQGLFCVELEGSFNYVLISVESKTGEEVEGMLVKAEKAEVMLPGSSYESAIEIYDAGTYTAIVEGAPVYYHFVSYGSVTVTITDKENAVLCKVTYSLAGESIEPTVDGTFTDPNAFGFTYFLIDAAEWGGFGEFEFTVEFTPAE